MSRRGSNPWGSLSPNAIRISNTGTIDFGEENLIIEIRAPRP